MKKINRLLTNEQFKEVINNKHKLFNSSFNVYYKKNDVNKLLVGICVSKKTGIAVLRNKIKRQVRMMCRDLLNIDYSYSLVIVINKNYLNLSYQENYNNLKDLIKKIK